MKTLRKLISILLLALSGLPFVSPLFASTATSGTNLPACCRRNGQHHCMAGMAERKPTAGTNQLEFRAPLERCPYCPASMLLSHHSDPGLAPAAATFAAVVSHPVVLAQTESKWRIARDRSRNKRGPPSPSRL